MTVVCYPSPGKRKALGICTAFAEGCGGGGGAGGGARVGAGGRLFFGSTGPHPRPIRPRHDRSTERWEKG